MREESVESRMSALLSCQRSYVGRACAWEAKDMQTCKMVSPWVKGTGVISATGMLVFYSLDVYPPTHPEYELLEFFISVFPAPGTTWHIAGAQETFVECRFKLAGIPQSLLDK